MHGNVEPVSVQTASTQTQEKTFFGQPPVLANLFGVELWERFSFYGMQGILLIYLYYSAADGGLGMDQGTAAGIVGAYGGLVYLSTILGAWVADRLLGSERTLFYSAVVIMLGHIALALLPGFLGVGAGLLLVGVGSGGLKANATSLVGTLYDERDPRRDAGFSLFYLGINLGALAGPLLTGLAQKNWGFHFGFGLAAVGMAVGLVQYTLGRSRLPEESHHISNPLPAERRKVAAGVGVVAVALIAVLVLTGVLTATNLENVVIGAIIVASVAYFAVILSSSRVSKVERSRVVAFIPLFIASAAFWSLFQQQFTVVTIYFDERVNRTIFGWEMPVSWAQSINPVFIILMAGAFAGLWTRLGSRQPSTPLKFALGTAVMGLAFLAFIPMSGGGANSAPFLGLVGVLFLFTVAELLLSPVGLSLATKLAPAIFRTQMVALFFLSVALGSAMSGFLAGFYSADNEVAYFGVLGGVAIALGVLLAAFSRPIRKLMAGVH